MIGRLCSEETLVPNGKGCCRSGQGLIYRGWRGPGVHRDQELGQSSTGSSGHGRKELLAEPFGSPRTGRAKGVTGQERGVLAEPSRGPGLQ